MCLFQAHARSFRLKQPTSFDEQLSAVPQPDGVEARDPGDAGIWRDSANYTPAMSTLSSAVAFAVLCLACT
jgi:hypothetical protein